MVRTARFAYSAHATVTELCRAMADATRLRLCTLAQVAEELQGRPRFRGSGRLRQAHGELSGQLDHSRYERLGRSLLREAGVAVASSPQPVIYRGRPIAEIDIPFLDLDYGVEIDGPPHSSASAGGGKSSTGCRHSAKRRVLAFSRERDLF